MKLYKKLNRTLVASLSLTILGVSLIASAMYFANPFSKSNAGVQGGGSQSSFDSISGASTVTSGDFISNSNMGYRLYFAENTMQPDGTFGKSLAGNSTYKNLAMYSTIAIYQFRNWSGNNPRTWGEIHTWSPWNGYNEATAHEADFNNVFGGVFESSSTTNLPAVNLQQAIGSGNDWTKFINYCDIVKKDQSGGDFLKAFTSYVDYINANPLDF